MPVSGSYLSENDLQGIPILNPFLTHTVIVPSSTSNSHISGYRHIWASRVVPVASPLKSTLDSEKNFFLGSIFDRRDTFPQKASAELVPRGETPFRSKLNFGSVWIFGAKYTLLHAGMITYTLLGSVIACGSRKVAIIVVIWAVIHTTLVSLQIGAFDLSRWWIVQKVHD